MENSKSNWSPRLKLIVGLLSLAFVIYLIATFSAIIPSVILAIIVAYILTPFVDALSEKAKFPKWAALITVYLLAILVLFTLALLFYQPLALQATLLYEDIQTFFAGAENLFDYQIIIVGQVIDGSTIFENATSILQDISQPFVGHTLDFAVEVISSLVELSFIIIISIYLIIDSKDISIWMEEIVPSKYRADFIDLREKISKIWAAFFRGQLLLSLISATIYTIGGFIIGIPFALPMGVLAGLMEFAPHIGPGIWAVIAGIIALASGSTWIAMPNWVFALVILGLQVVYVQFDYNYLIPRIIGKRVQLSPLVIILGIMAGASMAGVLGVLLASPIIASGRVLFLYIYFNIFEETPGQKATTVDLPPPDPHWWQLKKHEHAKQSKKQEELKE